MGIKIQVITTLHGTDITLIGSDPSCKPVINYSINNSDGVTSVSESLKNDTIKLFDIKKDIKVIPNFIDHDIFNKSRISSLAMLGKVENQYHLYEIQKIT